MLNKWNPLCLSPWQTTPCDRACPPPAGKSPRLTGDVRRFLRVDAEGVKHLKVCPLHLYGVVDGPGLCGGHRLGEGTGMVVMTTVKWYGRGWRGDGWPSQGAWPHTLGKGLTPVGSRVQFPSTQNLYWCSPSGKSTMATKLLWLTLGETTRDFIYLYEEIYLHKPKRF